MRDHTHPVTPGESPTLTLDDGVVLCAPGGVYLPTERALVVADLHAGYVATLQKRGFTLPSQDDADLHARLRALLDRTDPATVVIAGDLVHGAPALAARGGTPSPLAALLEVLSGRAVVVVPGNHDRAAVGWLMDRGVRTEVVHTVGPHTVVHGDGDPARLRGERALALARGGRVILGHHHPALTLDDGAGARARVPAFAHAPGLLCLPALTPRARGADLLRTDHAAELTEVVDPAELSLAVVVGQRVIPVGTLAQVRAVRSVRRTGRASSAG